MLTNVAPAVAPAPGNSALNLTFSNAVAGTVVDKAGKGTGFTSVQANTAGNQSVPANINLDTTAGRLMLTSTAGTATNSVNTLQNGLLLSFNGTTKFRQETRLMGPFTNLTSGAQQNAMFFGTDQNNYVKIEVENVSGGSTSLTTWIEKNGTGSIGQRVTLSNKAAATLDFRLEGNPATNTVQASYRIASDTAAFTNLGTAVSVPAAWFNQNSTSGISVSNEGSSTAIVGVYDSFSIKAF